MPNAHQSGSSTNESTGRYWSASTEPNKSGTTRPAKGRQAAYEHGRHDLKFTETSQTE